MKVINTPADFVAFRNSLEGTIALVPTMGNLHAGHLSLVEKATELADLVMATIFVNPMQFGANEDLDNYPRTLEADLSALEALGVNAVFTPNLADIYPEGVARHTQISVPELSTNHCGAERPGHFTGVATIVCKLFNICRPDLAVFGQKDYQQLAIIRKMVSDLAIQTEIVGMPTVRNDLGLALSSRNNYLSEAEQRQATKLYATLSALRDSIIAGSRDYQSLSANALTVLNEHGFTMEYVNIVDQINLLPATADARQLVILSAVKLACNRKIDNVYLNLY